MRFMNPVGWFDNLASFSVRAYRRIVWLLSGIAVSMAEMAVERLRWAPAEIVCETSLFSTLEG